MGVRAVVARGVRGVCAGPDERAHADHCPARTRNTFRRRAHIVVDRMDGGSLGVRRTSRTRGSGRMIVVLLIVHGLLAVTLLGAITHQALSVAPGSPTAGPRSFVR